MDYTIDNINNALQVKIFGKILSKKDAELLNKDLNKKIDKITSNNKVANVEFNLKGLKMISGLGLGFLINTFSKCKNNGGKCTVNNLNQTLQKIFITTKLNSVFEIS